MRKETKKRFEKVEEEITEYKDFVNSLLDGHVSAQELTNGNVEELWKHVRDLNEVVDTLKSEFEYVRQEVLAGQEKLFTMMASLGEQIKEEEEVKKPRTTKKKATAKKKKVTVKKEQEEEQES
jgi:outer membrane murein-binding lipoprotein Lpp